MFTSRSLFMSSHTLHTALHTQAINKVDPDDQVTVGVPFDSADMKMMEAICTQVGITLRRCLTEVLVARKNLDEEDGNG
jgi:hypothetical protein